MMCTNSLSFAILKRITGLIGVEGLTVYRAVSIFVSYFEHLVDFFFGEPFAKRKHDLANFFAGNGAAAVFVEYLHGVSGKS